MPDLVMPRESERVQVHLASESMEPGIMLVAQERGFLTDDNNQRIMFVHALVEPFVGPLNIAAADRRDRKSAGRYIYRLRCRFELLLNATGFLSLPASSVVESQHSHQTQVF